MAKKQYKSEKELPPVKERIRQCNEDLSQYLTHPITFIFGSPGVGKTNLATRLALNHLRTGADRVIVSRPQIECDGEKMGHLPGLLTEKMAPWLLPFKDVLSTILGSPKYAEELLETFESLPLAFVRGRSFTDCTAILDEAQNCTKAQLKAFCTRLGSGGKIVITGDANQSDLHPSKQCLLRVADELTMAGVASIHVLTKNWRTELMVKIEDAFEKVK